MPAQAVHDCVPTQAPLNAKALLRHQQAKSSDGSPMYASWKLAHPFPTLWICRPFRNGLAYLQQDLNTAQQNYSRTPGNVSTTCR